MSPEQRKDYTDAVLCLQSKPALTSAAAPGAKSRFDDYGMSCFNLSPSFNGCPGLPRVQLARLVHELRG